MKIYEFIIRKYEKKSVYLYSFKKNRFVVIIINKVNT